MPDFSVIGVGSPMVDVLSQVEETFLAEVPGDKGGMVMLAPDELHALLARLEGRKQTLTPGGSAGNTLFDLAHFGVRTALLGTVGNDEAGNFYRQQLMKAGGSAHALRETTDVPTGHCICLVTPDAERTMRPCLGAALSFDLDSVTEQDFQGYTLAHVEGYLLAHTEEKLEHLLSTAKRAGCKVSLDLASFEVVKNFRPAIERLLQKYVDVAFANAEEADALLGHGEVTSQLAKFRQLVPMAIIKQGADGAWADLGQGPVFIAARKVKAVDTTAAGDSFAAGFLYGFLSGWNAAKCGNLGAAVAAETVQVIGAALPDAAWRRLRDLAQ